MKYIHYGSRSFDSAKFMQPVNRPGFNKPYGGIWASPVGAKYGWKEWNKENYYSECKEENSFTFSLRENANILHIRSKEDFDLLSRQENDFGFTTIIPVDYEKMVVDGWDAIELHLSDNWDLYFDLYGWDCDSILILNKEVIHEGKKWLN